MLAVSLVTLGSPSQLTGGYLYHRRLADAAPAHDAEVRFVSMPDLPFPWPALSGRRALRQATAGTDVIVLDSIAAAFVVPFLQPGPPLVASVHQGFGGIDHGPVRRWLQAPLDRRAYRRAAVVVAASEALAAELVAGGLDRSRVEVVPPGCDLGPPGDPVPDPRRGRRAAFVAVGNWVQRKGILDLVDAFGRLPDDAATLHLVGRDDVDPRYAVEVHERLRTPHLAGRVVVHGPLPRDRVAALLAAADGFVLPSLREPYGTVYGEALAMGVPVVGWRAGNLPHLAEDGVSGLLVEPGDVPGLAAALVELATDEGLRERLRQGAARCGAALPTWDQSMGRFFEILRRTAG